MLILYSFALLVVLVVGSPWWLLRMATGGKYREGLTERLGRVPDRIRAGIRGRPVIWLHAVSVGELLAASRLVEELERQLSARAESDWRVVISTTTRTGQRLAKNRYGADRVFYFPLDFRFAVRAWLRTLHPAMVVLMETEFWPRMLVECRQSGVPVAVVNARISDRSWPRYRRLARLWRGLLRGVHPVMAQTELDAGRLRAIGAGQVKVGGNLKYDVRAAQSIPIVAALQNQMAPGIRVLVCGSTLAGEEELLLDAFPRNAVMVLAPRHPERFAAVANLLERRGVGWVRRSTWMEAPSLLTAGTVVLLDSLGELASVYALAHAAFIGGSLVSAGGHNPLEAAQFGVPIVMGTSYENFRDIVEKLRVNDGIRIVAAEELKGALADALTGSAKAMGSNARVVYESEAGATDRAVAALMEVLRVEACIGC